MFDLIIDLQTISAILQVIIIVVAAFVLVKVFDRLVARIALETMKARKRVLVNVRRFIRLIIYSTAAILILWTFNVNVTGLVAGLGVGALVIGFALKDIIENWVSGLLIMSGKIYKIGDVIKVGDLTGIVTDVSLRTTKLKTYDQNAIIIPNSVLLKQNIINITGGKKENVATIKFSIDYIFDVEKAKAIIERVVSNHPNVVVDGKRREIRFVVRSKEWITEIETLFWINDPENEEFIKSRITEKIKKEFEKENIFPPIPGIIRKEFLNSRK